jgi:thiol:disulfide interchange protein DsbD
VARPAAPPLVDVSLHAASSHVRPGEPIELAVRFAIAPGWHVYWINPGESGLATRVDWIAPEPAWPVEIRYPGPTAFDLQGVVSYGYQGETVLFARATAPPTLSGDAVSITLRARWLACREECIPGEAVRSIELPVGAASPVVDDVVDRHRAALPLPAPPGLRHEWRPAPDALVLAIAVPGADEVELFPFADQPALFRGQDRRGDRAEARFARGAPGAAGAVTGVLRVVRGGVARYHSISIPWPPAPGSAPTSTPTEAP